MAPKSEQDMKDNGFDIRTLIAGIGLAISLVSAAGTAHTAVYRVAELERARDEAKQGMKDAAARTEHVEAELRTVAAGQGTRLTILEERWVAVQTTLIRIENKIDAEQAKEKKR